VRTPNGRIATLPVSSRPSNRFTRKMFRGQLRRLSKR
jgi:hypothetical protein